jgi:hypothetical protein
MTRRGIGAIAVGLFLVASAGRPAIGQGDAALPTRSATYGQMAKVCAAELLRFCQPIAQATALERDQAMCLKLYRADLSPACRYAVVAATALRQPSQ